MSLYTVHVPDSSANAMTRGENTRFVREGFNVAAFVFGLLYLLAHRLWIAAAAWIAIVVLISAFAAVFHPPLVGPIALLTLMHLYAGTEGPELHRSGLTRRGYTLRDIVSAPDIDTAEALFFARQSEMVPSVPSPSDKAARFMGPSAVPSIIGLYPDDGGRA